MAGTALNVAIGDYGENSTGLNKWSVGSAAMGFTMTFVGALIASRRPENPVGWLLCLIGFSQGLDTFVTAYAIYGLDEEPGSLPLAAEAAWMSGWDFAPGITALLIWLPLVFPAGRLLSPLWRIAVWLGALELLLFTVPLAITTWQYRGLTLIFEEIPEDASTAAQIASVFQFLSLILALSLGVAAVVSVIKRYRLSEGHERLQLKWFAYAVAAQIVVTVIVLVMPEKSPVAIAAGLIWSTLIPAGVGIAILRHRLYEIDVIINRTLVYLPLTGILAGLYVAMTGFGKEISTEFLGNSDAVVVLSTLAVVGLLTPLKNKLQMVVDRYFKEQPDPMAAVRRLSSQARNVAEVFDTNRFVSTLLQELRAGLGAEGATVQWIGGRAISAGAPNDLPPLQVPLVQEGQRLGTLFIWPSPVVSGTDETSNEEIAKAAEALAQVLSLSREVTASWPASVSAS
jgi:hypothetical protein